MQKSKLSIETFMEEMQSTVWKNVLKIKTNQTIMKLWQVQPFYCKSLSAISDKPMSLQDQKLSIDILMEEIKPGVFEIKFDYRFSQILMFSVHQSSVTNDLTKIFWLIHLLQERWLWISKQIIQRFNFW